MPAKGYVLLGVENLVVVGINLEGRGRFEYPTVEICF